MLICQLNTSIQLGYLYVRYPEWSETTLVNLPFADILLRSFHVWSSVTILGDFWKAHGDNI